MTEFTYVIERFDVRGEGEELIERAELTRDGDALVCLVQGREERTLEATDVPAAIAGDAPGSADGDYPPWLAQEQVEWFPRGLITKYGGNVYSSVLNGEALDLPGDKAEHIAEDLRSMGHTVSPTDLEFE